MAKVQHPDQVVDIAGWVVDEEFGVYPEGARDKSLVYCPSDQALPFLKPRHRYLFKKSFKRYPDQFWVEVVAYRFGQLIGVKVPPAFVAVHEQREECGALIEWFLSESANHQDRYVAGGDWMQRLIPDYDRKTGKQHNFESIEVVAKALGRGRVLPKGYDWREAWLKILLFDALIGNTDRHQDNWGTISTIRVPTFSGVLSFLARHASLEVRFTPAFDNGTSMGHEFFEKNFNRFDDSNYTQSYIEKGTHHARWRINDDARKNHADFIYLFAKRFPRTRPLIRKMLSFKETSIDAMLDELTKFDVSTPLNEPRAMLMKKLILARQRWLTQKLETML